MQISIMTPGCAWKYANRRFLTNETIRQTAVVQRTTIKSLVLIFLTESLNVACQGALKVNDYFPPFFKHRIARVNSDVHFSRVIIV